MASADGSLSIALADGPYLLSTSASGYGTATLHVSAPAREIRVGLTPGGTLVVESERELRGRVRLVRPDGLEYVQCWCNGIADIEVKGRRTTIENITPDRYAFELVEEGRLGEDELLLRAAEMLTCKERVGLLDAPLAGTDPEREARLLAGPATAYRDLALASVVLLRPTRPDPAVLPLPPAEDGSRVAVLGPLADQDPEDWLGAYSSHANRHLERVTTPLMGIRKRWPEAAYARGCDYDSGDEAELGAAAEAAAGATHVVLFLGEPHEWSGESATLAEPRLPEVQRRLVQRVRTTPAGAWWKAPRPAARMPPPTPGPRRSWLPSRATLPGVRR